MHILPIPPIVFHRVIANKVQLQDPQTEHVAERPKKIMWNIDYFTEQIQRKSMLSTLEMYGVTEPLQTRTKGNMGLLAN
jgi:hypothetical protein